MSSPVEGRRSLGQQRLLDLLGGPELDEPLVQLGRGPLLDRDVDVGTDHAGRPPLAVAHGGPAGEDPAVGPVLVAEAVLQLVLRRTAFQVVLDRPARAVAVVRMHAGLPFRELVADLVLRVPEHALPAGREVERVGAEVPVPDAGVGAAHGQVEPLLAPADRLDRLAFLGDILHDPDITGQRVADPDLGRLALTQIVRPSRWTKR